MRTIKKLIGGYNRRFMRKDSPCRLWFDEFSSAPGYYRIYVECGYGSSLVEFESVKVFKLWVNECLI